MIIGHRIQFILLGFILLAAFPQGGSAQQQWQPRGPAQDIGTARQTLLAEVPAVETYDILLITVDSLSPDALGCYGSTRSNPSPHIDRLARRSHVFEAAFAPSADPDIALLALASSLLPSSLSAGMSEACPSLVTLFADHNFNTRGVLDQGLIDSLKVRLDRVDETLGFGRRISKSNSAATKASVAARLASGSSNRATLVHLHLDATRPPATNHPGFDFGTSPDDHYAGAVRWVDQAVGQLIDTLRKSKVDQRTIIVLTAPSPANNSPSIDSQSLHDQNLQVPLMVFVPGLPTRRVTQPVSTIDIAPSLASLHGFPAAYSFQGRSFLSVLVGTANSPRTVYAERLSAAHDGTQLLATSVRSADWRMTIGSDNARTLFTDSGATASAAQQAAAPTSELMQNLEDCSVYITACNQIWSRGEEIQPDMLGAQGQLSRAEWLIAKGDSRAHKTLLELLKTTQHPTPLLMEFLLKVGLPGDAPHAVEALESDNIEVRALAAAFLVRQGREDALNHALAGLCEDMRPHRQVILLRQLGTVNKPEVLKGVLEFKPKHKEGLAARTLALIQLGHRESEADLIRHILDPATSYTKMPFIEAYALHFPNRAPDVFSLALSDGDPRPDTISAVLKQIGAMKSSHLDDPVASTIDHDDRRVRTQAATMLQSWNSLAGTEGLLRLAAQSPTSAGWAAAQLMNTPLLIGSPALPGIRLDVLASSKAPKNLVDGLVPLDWVGQQFAFQLASDQMANHLIIVFRKPKSIFEADDIVVIINGKHINSTRAELEPHGNQLVLSVPLAKNAVEKGANQVHLRARKTAVGTLPFAFFVMTQGNRHEVQGGIEKTSDACSVTLDLDRDQRVFRLWAEGVGALPDGVKPTRISVQSAEGLLGRITLPRDGGSLSRTLKLPARAWRLTKLALQIEGGSPAQRAAAVVTGTR